MGGAGGGIIKTSAKNASTLIISAAGLTSSFGSLLSALGGGGSSYSVRSAQGSRRGLAGHAIAHTSQQQTGGNVATVLGAAGWMPGITFLPPTENQFGFIGPINGAGAGLADDADSYPYAGAGYGAGGGSFALARYTLGDNYVCSGNAGEIKQGSFKLASASALSVTVGTGGAAYKAASQTQYNIYTSGGAPGCVAVFW